MAVEIERKFLIKDGALDDALSSSRAASHIVQGYLSLDKERTVRVRIRGDKGYLTIKGPTNGVSRYEWEQEIPIEEAKRMISLCAAVIDKTRHLIDFEGHVFELDVFHGANEGLVVAEVELKSEDEEFQKPSWLGEEVSHDHRYYNSQLLLHPYSTWPKKGL